ncbi:hypothetical protein ABT56_19800 [Photobacterium aquae]|uniref:Uncharacterized protein n=1 Tax=Photobacterium aquae TaxID=1195763 RepID=A0A0J1GUH5_9GAMM|nr:Imm51 family immunity protein [Photobacterium aquae]KLV03368.1 hypothetical protein ABT56_19800 [Photobacterium aquae]
MSNNIMYPFICSEENEVYSLLLSSDMKWEIFDKKGFLGNGHDWNRLIRALLEEQSPDTLGSIQFDSEADMFCVRSESKEALQFIAERVSQFYDNDRLMEDAVSRYAQYR